MKRAVVRTSALVLMMAGGIVSAASSSGFIYTANERDGSISEIALATGRVRTFDVAVVPHNIQVTPDNAYLLVVGMPSADHSTHDVDNAPGTRHSKREATQPTHGTRPDDGEGNLLIFDVRNLKEPAALLPAGRHPAHVITDRDGRRAFVTSSEESAITVVDLAGRTVVGKIGTGASPHGLRPSPDGRELYVANVGDGSVSVIDTATLKEVARIPVGRAPVQVGFTPDGRQVYVSLRDENSVAVIDTANRRLTRKIDVARNPIQVYATPDGKTMYVANQGNANAPDDKVSVIDLASGKVKATVTTGAGAHGVVVDDRGQAAFVTNIEVGTVSAIDATSQMVTATFDVGAGPNGITFRPEAPARAGRAKRSTN